MAAHNELGIKGETIAREHLILNGYKILEKNWRTGKSEVDIIAQKDNLIVFSEIKSRSTAVFGEPEQSVNHKKQQMLIEAADIYMQDKGEHLQSRFDVISIVFSGNSIKLNHIEGAFSPSW